jgi:ABC-type transport system involved in multi-copper enzyme maturation permease subunit
VALATFKSEAAQPLFMIVVVLGIVSLVIFIFIPYNTFGEDIKVLKDSGMTLIMVLCIIQAIWAASTSVADEIDGRTALTVLSKPIGRRSFIIGKYLGIFWTVAVLFIVLGLVLLICVAWKPIYDAREGTPSEPTWQICHLEMIRVVPGLALAFMETIVLAAISVAISTRLPMVANFIICFSIYVLGHLTPLVVQSSVSQFEPVRFVAELVATILPNLDHFNIQAAVAAGVGVPNDYLGWSLLYCLIYGVIALMLALVLFEDRDLA